MLVGCPGCAGLFPDDPGPVHPYMTTSPGCWRGFGELLAADYASPRRMAFHQVVVDAYAAQHPGDGADPRQVQSVGLHLMTLCLFLEHDADPDTGTALHRRMIRKPVFRRLQRSSVGGLTWRHVPSTGDPDEARQRAYEWANAVWASYAPEHATVREWLDDAGFDTSPRRAAT